MNGSLLSLLATGPTRTLGVLIVEVTLVLGLATLVARSLRRRSAAIRHLVWASAAAAVLVLAAASPFPRLWTVEVPVPLGRVAAGEIRNVSITVLAGREAQDEDARVARHPVVEGAIRAGERGWFGGRLALLWIAGMVLVLVFRAAGTVAVARLVRHGMPVNDPELLALFECASRRVGLRRRVRLRWLGTEGSPCTCGVLRPIVLLPPSARSWSRERLELVLVHELVHVSRADALTGVVADLACAAVWMHPGPWLAARRLREERERACDEAVLRYGVEASTYARQLLDIAREFAAARPVPVLAMAQRRVPALERRIRALLTDGSVRRPLPLAGALSVPLLLLIPAVLLACAELTGPSGRQVAAVARSAVASAAAPALAAVSPDGQRPSALPIDDPPGVPDESSAFAAGETMTAAERAQRAAGLRVASGRTAANASPENPMESLLPPTDWNESDAKAGDARDGCWAVPAAKGSSGHSVVVYAAGHAESGTFRLRLIPERIDGDGAGMASVRNKPPTTMRCRKAGVAGIRLAGSWNTEDVATILYSADSKLYLAAAEGELMAPVEPPAGDQPFDCEITPASDHPIVCRPANGDDAPTADERTR